MGNFSFNSLANSTGVASDKRLKPFSINKVKFVEAKSDILHSEKNGTDYKILKLRWENESGFYEENFFLPSTTGKDVERQANNWGGESPSNADRAMMFFAHTLSVINHDGFEKLKKVVGKCKSFEEVAGVVAKLLNEKKGTECYLKLTGRDNNGVIYASLPYFTAVSKDGEAYINNNFLSLKDDLAFTPNEDKKRQEAEKAKPTQMPSDPIVDAVADVPEGDNSDINEATQEELGELLNGL